MNNMDKLLIWAVDLFVLFLKGIVVCIGVGLFYLMTMIF